MRRLSHGVLKISLTGTSCNGRMYVSGGRTDEPMGMEDTNALVCYHDDTDDWVQCAPMRHNRYYHGMAAVDQVDVSITYTGAHLHRPRRCKGNCSLYAVARCKRTLFQTGMIACCNQILILTSGGSRISRGGVPTPRVEPFIRPNFPPNCTEVKKIWSGRGSASKICLCRCHC